MVLVRLFLLGDEEVVNMGRGGKPFVVAYLPFCLGLFAGGLFESLDCKVGDADKDEQGERGGEVFDDVNEECDEDSPFGEGLECFVAHGVPCFECLFLICLVYLLGFRIASCMPGVSLGGRRS